jgi:DNA-binding response OmpR family regulator
MPKKIVVADDEEEIIELLKFALEPCGYAVEGISHGSSLLPRLKLEKPDLLILDVLLPGIDGYSLQLQMAQDACTSTIPVLIITALPASRTLFEKFDQVKGFINKPFNTDALVERVRHIVGE